MSQTTSSVDVPASVAQASNAPFVVGYTLLFGLTGSLVVQSYIYFTNFPDDRRPMKVLVTVVLLLEASMTGFIFSGFWESTSISWNIGASSTPVSSLIILAPMAGLVTTLTQGFYCWRIWSFQRFRVIPLSIMMLSLAQFASLWYFAWITNPGLSGLSPREISPHSIIRNGVSNGSSGSPSLPALVSMIIWLVSSAVCDLTITICMILSFRPSQSSFRNGKLMLIKLTRFTIETGLVTTIAAILELINLFKDRYYHLALFYILSKLYANCLLASLNFRLVLRNPQNLNLTEIVRNDLASNTTSRRWDTQSAHVVPTYPRAESVVDIAVDPNENQMGRSGSVEVHELHDLSTRV